MSKIPKNMNMRALLSNILLAAALLHDVGKQNAGFQSSLLDKGYNNYRHEFYSMMFLANIVKKNNIKTDREFLQFMMQTKDFKPYLSLGNREIIDVVYKGVDMPIFGNIYYICATHHRMVPGVYERNDNVIEFTVGEYQRSDSSASDIFPDGKKYLWEYPEWHNSLYSVCESLLDLLDDNCSTSHLYEICGIHGTTIFRMGDYFASANKLPSAVDTGEFYANTTLVDGVSVLADTLLTHKLKVYNGVLKAFSFYFADVPSVDIPASLLEPAHGRYEWQNRAVELAQNSSSGLPSLTFMFAGTGTGKTKTAVKLIGALRNKLRFNTLLSLRSLTLQTGDAYLKEVGLGYNDCSIIIGSKVSELMHNADKLDEKFDGYAVINKRQIDAGDREYLSVFAGKSKRKVPCYFTPVICSTVDMLIDGVTKTDIISRLRLSNSDLILDEIDSYSEEDHFVICQMIFVAACSGRNIIVASATMPEETVKAIHMAYEHGIRVHNAFQEQDSGYSVFFVSEHIADYIDLKCDANQFESAYRASIEKHIACLQAVKRRVEYVPMRNDAGADEYFDTVYNQIGMMANNHFVVGDKGRISIGIVRFNNVSTVRRFMAYCQGRDNHRYICYHSRFPNVIKGKMEKYLLGLMNRKYVNGVDPATLITGDIGDGVIILVTSPIVETGRDFDADWAITEPCSNHSLVQLAGRVLRHRDIEVTHPNVASALCSIMWRCIIVILGLIHQLGISTTPIGIACLLLI